MVQPAGEVEFIAEVEGDEEGLVDGEAEHVADDDDDKHAPDVATRPARQHLADYVRLVRDVPTKRHRHPHVTEREDGERQDELQQHGDHPEQLLRRLARVERHYVAAAVDDAASRHHERRVEDGPRQPGGDTHPVRHRHRHARAVPQRVDDGDVALEREADQVVGGRHENAPWQEGWQPYAAEEVVEQAGEVAVVGDRRRRAN